MTKWPMVLLGDLMHLRTPDVDVCSDGEYHFAGVYCFGGGAFVGQKKTGLEFAYKRLTRLHAQDFTYPKLMAWEGAFAVVPPECDGLVVSTEFPVFKIDESKLLPEFIGYYFKRASVWPEVAGNSTGTNVRRRRLHPSNLLKHRIPLPPLEEQKRIVEYLDLLRNRVEEAKQLRAEADDKHRWLWQGASKMLVENLGDIPWLPLGDLCEISGGGTPSKQNPHFWGGDIPWITPKEMKAREITGSIDTITQDGLSSSSARMLPMDAVLIVIRGMILVHTVPVAILRVPATINQDMKALIPTNKLLPEFLCSVLWGLNQELLNCVDKSSHDTRKLTTPKLLDFRIPVPSLAVQRKLILNTEDLNKTQHDADLIAEDCGLGIDALLPTIIDQVFTGDAA